MCVLRCMRCPAQPLQSTVTHKAFSSAQLWPRARAARRKRYCWCQHVWLQRQKCVARAGQRHAGRHRLFHIEHVHTETASELSSDAAPAQLSGPGHPQPELNGAVQEPPVRQRTCVVVQEPDFRQCEGVVDRQEDGGLHQNVDHVQGGVAKEEGRGVEACRADGSSLLRAERRPTGGRCASPALLHTGAGRLPCL